MVHLHDFYVCGIRAGPPLTGRRTTCISMTFTFTAPRTLRATPYPAVPRTLPKSASGLYGGGYSAGHPAPYRAANAANSLYWPSGPTGGGQFAGNPAPCHAPHAAKIGWRAFRHPALCGQPRTLPCRSRFFFPFLFAVGFMWRCGIFYVAGGSLTLPYRFRREDAAHEWGRRRQGNVHHAARSAFYGKVSLSSVGEDH